MRSRKMNTAARKGHPGCPQAPVSCFMQQAVRKEPPRWNQEEGTGGTVIYLADLSTWKTSLSTQKAWGWEEGENTDSHPKHSIGDLLSLSSANRGDHSNLGLSG